jgi:hypothetical protein
MMLQRTHVAANLADDVNEMVRCCSVRQVSEKLQ